MKLHLRCLDPKCRRFLAEFAMVGATGLVRIPCSRCGGSTSVAFEDGVEVGRSYERKVTILARVVAASTSGKDGS